MFINTIVDVIPMNTTVGVTTIDNTADTTTTDNTTATIDNTTADIDIAIDTNAIPINNAIPIDTNIPINNDIPIDNATSDFSVSIRQEPIRGRMCGLGDTVARRMLDPPLIIQFDFNEKKFFTDHQIKAIFLRYLCYVTIHSCNILDESVMDASILIPNPIRSLSRGHSPYLNTLLGQRVISPLYLNDFADGENRFFFVFSDLAIRIQGDFILKCYIIDVAEYVLSKIEII